jgi:hypothetical protein
MFCSVEKTNVISDIKLRNRTEKRIFNTLLVLRDSRPVENISSTSEIYLMGCHQDGLLRKYIFRKTSKLSSNNNLSAHSLFDSKIRRF